MLKPIFDIIDSHDQNSVAIHCHDVKVTYQTFQKRISEFENEFRNFGILKDNKVAILFRNSAEFVYVVFALWKIGAIPIPLNIKLTDSEINDQIDFIECDFILMDDSLDSRTIIHQNVIRMPQNFSPKSFLNNESFFDSNFSETALILFTSGTSEKPKAVILSFENIFSSSQNAIEFLKLNQNDKFLASLPFYHIGGFLILIRAFICGGSVVIPKEISTDEIIYNLTNFDINVVSLVPTVLKKIVDENIPSPKNLNSVLLGGAHADSDLIKAALKLNYNIIKVYGSTETSAFVTALKVNDNITKIDSVGKPLHNNTIKILKFTEDEFKHSFIGQVAVKSSGVMKGYFKIDHKKFQDGFYLTGDIGFIDYDGYLVIESRRNDLIISGGENINPFEIEDLISKINFVKEVCVFGLKNEKWGEVPAAAIIVDQKKQINHGILKDEIIAFLKDKITSYKIPKEIFIVEDLPKTELGKLKRSKIKEIFNQDSSL